MAHLGHRAIAVIGHGIDQHRYAARPITFVANLLVLDAVQRTGAALDRPVNGVTGHIGRQRLVHHQPQARIGAGITTAHTRRDGDLADQSGEQFATLGVLGVLAMLNVRPLAMSSHKASCLHHVRLYGN